jgi:hypothetical protein
MKSFTATAIRTDGMAEQYGRVAFATNWTVSSQGEVESYLSEKCNLDDTVCAYAIVIEQN